MNFSLAALLSPRGRLNRRFFCYYLLAYVVLCYAAQWIGLQLMKLHVAIGMLVTLILILPLIGAMVCQVFRRYHDFGLTGWIPGSYLLVAFVFSLLRSPRMLLDQSVAPLAWVSVVSLVLQVVGLLLIVFVPALVPSQKRANRYGAPSQVDVADKGEA